MTNYDLIQLLLKGPMDISVAIATKANRSFGETMANDSNHIEPQEIQSVYVEFVNPELVLEGNPAKRIILKS